MLEPLHTPELLLMAACTFRELTPVNIILGVALTTVLACPTELAPILMTLAALQRLVHADKLKILVKS